MTGKPPAFADHDWATKAPSHRKPQLPPMEDIAVLLRTGTTLEEIAEEFERHPATLRTYLNRAGYSTTGEYVTRRGRDDVPPPSLDKPFGYETWMDDGLCSQTNPDAFFPEKGESTRPAKAVCKVCPVRRECLTYALTNGERFGVWGGLSEGERRKLQKQAAA